MPVKNEAGPEITFQTQRAGDPVKVKGIQSDEHGIARNNIFSVLAHDLRSPFNTILGYCELLSISLRNKDTEKSKMYNKIIQDAAIKTLNLLNRLLDWGRMQQGQLKYNPELFNVSKHLSEIMGLMEFQAEPKKIKLIIQVDPGLMVYGDVNMIRTILINLISNGIKFSRTEGIISITVKIIPEGVEFVIADNGIGIEQHSLAELFFNRQPVMSNGTLTEGLGLSLCKDFIALHKGRIWAESEPGQGSRFKFILPSEILA